MSQLGRAGLPGASLARFVAVAVVVAGLLALILPLCGDGMAAMPIRPDNSPSESVDVPSGPVLMLGMSTGVCAVVELDSGVGQRGFGAPNLLPAVSGGSMPGPDGLRLACIVFLTAVLIAVFGLRPRWAGRITPTHATGPRVGQVTCLVRRLTLAELCVLRT